jgi:branched-chain amino acid transport system permease protein
LSITDGTRASWMAAAVGSFRKRRAVPSVLCFLLLLAILTVVLQLFASSELYVYDTFLLVAMGAVALNLVIGTGGQILIANPVLLMAGSFTAVVCSEASVPFPIDVPLAVVVSTAIGVIVGLPALRLRGLYLALSSIAALYIAIYFAQEYQSAKVSYGTFFVPVLFESQTRELAQDYWSWLLLILLACVIGVVSALTYGKGGRAWRVIRDHEIIAGSLGIGVLRYKLILVAVSSAIMGFQGAITAHFEGAVTYETYTLQLAITYVAMIFIGGLDSIVGAVLGAAVVTWLPQVLPSVIQGLSGFRQAGQYSAQISEIVYGLLVVAFVTSSTNGLVGLFGQLRSRQRRLWPGDAGPNGRDWSLPRVRRGRSVANVQPVNGEGLEASHEG